ncbi:MULTISPECIES: MFS transporter [Cyanophyceae]|uniref:MFS transporter n=1 Tax=Stenomitos frigidus AS-A4 TaxID=2933935 RepID=A0ABV0KMP4_9CYAN|nr:MFS transporter [Phormidium sp. FACHB-592]
MPIVEFPSLIAAKKAIRTSLTASTLDGVFAAIFLNVTGGVLLSNFLVELDASPTEVGLLSSIPMLANLIQPLGAFLGNRTTSRHRYCLWVYVPSRLIWLLLAAGIAFSSWHGVVDAHQLVWWTLATVCMTHFIGALGGASWLSWLASLVPRRLRGRYFGIRNCTASLTNLLSVPLLGFAVSTFPGGSVRGFGVVLLLGIVAGIISLGFQFFMVDVNPQRQREGIWGAEEKKRAKVGSAEAEEEQGETEDVESITQALVPAPLPTDYSPLLFLKDKNFLFFLLYFSAWMFAVNLSAPFFNLYMLDNLAIDVSWVTVYNSLQAGAMMVMLVLWGRLADRVGNRPILLAVGILVAITPLLWLGTGTNSLSLWLWLPLLHIVAGATWAAIDLCSNNLQLGVAPVQQQATYFAIAAAIAGISGAVGTTVGGFLAEFANYGGIPGLFALSAIVRLVALLPLILVHEQRGQSLKQMMQVLFPSRSNPALEATEAAALEEPVLEPVAVGVPALARSAQLHDATH